MDRSDMTQNKHTPGPWRFETWSYEDGRREVLTIQNDKDAVAQVLPLWCPDDRVPETEANAAVIAAAPELLAAMESLFENCVMVAKYGGDGCNRKQADEARAACLNAIAKAKGGAS